MRIWAQKLDVEEGSPSVARAALAGASREEWLREALTSLRRGQAADRIGVWLEPDSNAGSAKDLSGAFHGLVWDRATQEDCPPGWKLLSLEPPMPAQLFLPGKPFEQNLEDSLPNPVIGQLLGLSRAIWFPVAYEHHVKGLILLGSRGRTLAPSRRHVESVAAELALALEFQDQLRLNRGRTADLAFTRRLLETSPDALSFETWLSHLATDCVRQSPDDDAPAVAFVMIGLLRDARENSGATAAVDFRWCNGDPSWTRAVPTEPLARVWRRALEVRHVVGSEPPVTWPQTSVARIVAFPLEAAGQLLGVLVAGLPSGAASLATLDRLELRALLAATVLHRWRQREGASREALSSQTMLDLMSNPVVLLDDAGQITAASRGAKELFGRASRTSEAPTGDLSDLFCGRDRDRLRKWLQRELGVSAVRSGSEEMTQGELQNGIRVGLQLAPRQAGQPAAVLLQLENALEPARSADQVEAELQSVMEWLEEGVLLFDARENVRAVNTRFEQMAGLAPGEAGKIKTLEECIVRLQSRAVEPGRFAERWRELARGMQGGVREELHLALPAPRVLERSARPILDSIGRQLGRVEIYRDLSAQRVFQSKLLQTEKLAALGQMVTGIAHELSNPLTSIFGYAQRLLARQNALGHSEEARQIYQEAERAGTILRQLLLSARETVPERRLVSLNQIVMHAMELQRFSLAAEKIRVELALDPALPFVHGDTGQLQQVLINLLNNAHQALEEQGAGGTIRLRSRRAGPRRVHLEVEDSGPGVPEAIRANIFDPFFTTKPAGVGTGLGLSIVLSVVREHGGQVRIQKSPLGGALFQIELPAATERQQEDALNRSLRSQKTSPLEVARFASPADRGPSSLASWKGTRVLVVEDEPTVARLIADVLEEEGMQVDVLLDGREALDRAARQTYDLVICDMKMPGLDGQRFYQSLQRAANPLRERFLFVTGDVIAAQTREFLKRNRLPHVAKPFRVEELTERVHAVLKMKGGEQASVAEVS